MYALLLPSPKTITEPTHSSQASMADFSVYLNSHTGYDPCKDGEQSGAADDETRSRRGVSLMLFTFLIYKLINNCKYTYINLLFVYLSSVHIVAVDLKSLNQNQHINHHQRHPLQRAPLWLAL